MSDKLNLMALSMDYLFEGMEITEDIFNHTGKVVLIKGGDVLSAAKLSRLKKFNNNFDGIMVSAKTYQYLIEVKKEESINKHVDVDIKSGYREIKSDTKVMLDKIAEGNEANIEIANEITVDIAEKVNAEDVHDIIRSVNAPRPIDEYLQKHSVNVSVLNGLMAKWLNLSEEDVNKLILIGLMHDIGKTKLDPEILNAPRSLSNKEYQYIKTHPVLSYVMLGKEFDLDVREAVKYHHEKSDGSGYPEGLCEDQIPVFAKITAVSDIYDAMTSKRSYKDSVNPLVIISDFSEGYFAGLDPVLSKFFVMKMLEQMLNKKVKMSNGDMATIKYIMPNDIKHPIVLSGGTYRQVDEEYYCEEIIYDPIDFSDIPEDYVEKAEISLDSVYYSSDDTVKPHDILNNS